MAEKRSGRVCPVELAGSLDTRIRRWVQNPGKILGPYIREGMTALDLGCGPGFFSIEMAHLVGPAGRVIASDLQEGMLQKVRDKIEGTPLRERITIHRSGEEAIGIEGTVDFVLAFYMLHEVPDQGRLFVEIESILNPGGRMLIVEPPFHVSQSAFEETVKKGCSVGLKVVDRPRVILSKTAVLRKDP
ncbi:MAG: class I SAM-dependent methyltransferase [bacterium]